MNKKNLILPEENLKSNLHLFLKMQKEEISCDSILQSCKKYQNL